MLLAAFLVFDLSMKGCLRSTAAGATPYSAVHNYAFPASAGVMAALTVDPVSPATSTAAGVLACAWVFYVGVDRALTCKMKVDRSGTRTSAGSPGEGAALATLARC